MTPTTKTAESDSARAFREFVRQSTFDRSSVRPWERETLSPYLGLGNDAASQSAAREAGKSAVPIDAESAARR